MDETPNRDTYESTDLALSAALLAAGYPLSHVERRGGRGWFIFRCDSRIGATVAAYYAGHLTVDARTYGDHMRALKQALHAPAVAL